MSKNRKSIRLKGFDYAQPSWYYVTICTENKGNILGEIQNGKMILNEFGKIAETEWLNTKTIRPNVDLDYFVIMPDHMHGIVVINERQEYRINTDCRTRSSVSLRSSSLENLYPGHCQQSYAVTKQL